MLPHSCAEILGESSKAYKVKLSPLDQKILINIQLGVYVDMVDNGHNFVTPTHTGVTPPPVNSQCLFVYCSGSGGKLMLPISSNYIIYLITIKDVISFHNIHVKYCSVKNST